MVRVDRAKAVATLLLRQARRLRGKTKLTKVTAVDWTPRSRRPEKGETAVGLPTAVGRPRTKLSQSKIGVAQNRERCERRMFFPCLFLFAVYDQRVGAHVLERTKSAGRGQRKKSKDIKAGYVQMPPVGDLCEKDARGIEHVLGVFLHQQRILLKSDTTTPSATSILSEGGFVSGITELYVTECGPLWRDLDRNLDDGVSADELKVALKSEKWKGVIGKERCRSVVSKKRLQNEGMETGAETLSFRQPFVRFCVSMITTVLADTPLYQKARVNMEEIDSRLRRTLQTDSGYLRERMAAYDIYLGEMMGDPTVRQKEEEEL